MNKGLDRRRVKHILHKRIEEDTDLKYYLDNEYVNRIIDLLIEGIGEVVEENNEKLIEDLLRRR